MNSNVTKLTWGIFTILVKADWYSRSCEKPKFRSLKFLPLSFIFDRISTLEYVFSKGGRKREIYCCNKGDKTFIERDIIFAITLRI